jgi:hypothetical protein
MSFVFGPRGVGHPSEAVVRFTWALSGLTLSGLALISVVAGCTSGADGKSGAVLVSPSAVAVASAPAWTEPAAYGFVLTRGCDDAKPLGRYQVTVAAGTVTKSDRLDAPEAEPSSSADVDLGPVAGDGEEEIEVPTLGELVDMAQTATDDGGQVSTTVDATDGHPVKTSINVSDDGAASAAECWTVSNYQPAT